MTGVRPAGSVERQVEVQAAHDVIVAAVRIRAAQRAPLLVAFDGGSGAGKTTLSGRVAATLQAALVPSDDFYAAHITDAEWAQHSPSVRARLGIDWHRLRAEALEPLLAGRAARWRRFDFESGQRPDGTYGVSSHVSVVEPRAVIVLDGAYSTRPELGDLVDLSVLVDVPVAIRHARLAGREEASFLSSWHDRWDEPERLYFEEVRPPTAFDLVVS